MKPEASPGPASRAQPGTGVAAGFWAGKQNLLLATLGLYVLVLPIAHTVALRGLTFLVLLVLTLGLLAEGRRWPQFPLWQAWLAYAAVGLVAVFLAFDPAESAAEFRTEFLYCYAIFMVGSIWGGQLASFKPFALLLAAANLVLVSCALMFAGIDMSFASLMGIPAIAYAGVSANWILIVIFLHVWLILHLGRQQRRLLRAVLICLIAADLWAMMVGYNRQTMLALGVGIACWGLAVISRKFSWRRALALVLLLATVAMMFSFQLHRHVNISRVAPAPGMPEASTAELARSALTADPRWEIWRFSIEKIAEHPLVGGGLGRHVFRKIYPEFQPEVVEHWHAHNMILNKGIQMGIPGMLTFVFLWLALARELVRHARRSGARGSLAVAGLSVVAAVFAKNMTDDFFVRDVALLFWLVMGLLIGVLRSAPPVVADAESQPRRE